MTTETLRHGDLEALADLLRDQDARKVDAIVPARKMRSENGTLVVDDIQTEITEDGVTSRSAKLEIGTVFNEGAAAKLGVPVGYLKRLHAERPDLYDANINGWLHGNEDAGFGPDGRAFLVRSFAHPNATDGYDGFARALLSDTFKVIDHFDVLVASLEGIKKAGVDVVIDKCDLTERRMHVSVVAPQIQALAPALLHGYRNPFGHDWNAEQEARWRNHAGYEPGEEPVLFAGFVISNSEVGGGAFTITPRMVIKVCKNGLTISKDALRAVHLGGKMDEGVIKWSEETLAKTLELVTLKAADAVATFLDVDYMTKVIASLEDTAAKPLDGPLPEVVKTVGKKMLFSEAVTEGVLDHFLRGGQFTAGGVMQAVTSFAQTMDDADDAYALEEQAIKVLEMAASL